MSDFHKDILTGLLFITGLLGFVSWRIHHLIRTIRNGGHCQQY